MEIKLIFGEFFSFFLEVEFGLMIIFLAEVFPLSPFGFIGLSYVFCLVLFFLEFFLYFLFFLSDIFVVGF